MKKLVVVSLIMAVMLAAGVAASSYRNRCEAHVLESYPWCLRERMAPFSVSYPKEWAENSLSCPAWSYTPRPPDRLASFTGAGDCGVSEPR